MNDHRHVGKRAPFVCSSLRLLSALCAPAVILFFFLLPFTAGTSLSPPGSAQTAPLHRVEEEVVAFAWAPDGRLAYAVKRILKRGRVEMQRDDIWLLAPGGERKRIVNGEKLVKSPTPFSYATRSLLWSPDGTRLTAELDTSQVIDSDFNTKDSTVTLLLDQNGKEINIAGAQSIIEEGLSGAWLPDGVTVGFLTEASKPRLLFQLNSVRPVAGRGTRLFNESTFAAVAWDLRRGVPNAALAIERDKALRGPFRLVALDLVRETRRELAVLDGYTGELALAADGTKIAYFTNPQTLEIRDVNQPERYLRLAAGQGEIAWTPDGRRIVLKRGAAARDARSSPSRRTGMLVWFTIPPLEAQAAGEVPSPVEVAPEALLSGRMFRDFAVSPDGSTIAVTEPGSRHLHVFPLK
jgi:dipeptidyl aminopeptidase/acylaminoacyl peptidase